jgi:hypothetical protein
VWQVLFTAKKRARIKAASNDSKKVSLLYLYLLYDEERNREKNFSSLELFMAVTFHKISHFHIYDVVGLSFLVERKIS